MEIPEEVKVGPFTIPVVQMENVKEEEDGEYVGMFSGVDHKIFLKERENQLAMSETSLHEVLEAIAGIYGLETSHQNISTISAALFQVLHENNLKF